MLPKNLLSRVYLFLFVHRVYKIRFVATPEKTEHHICVIFVKIDGAKSLSNMNINHCCQIKSRCSHNCSAGRPGGIAVSCLSAPTIIGRVTYAIILILGNEILAFSWIKIIDFS